MKKQLRSIYLVLSLLLVMNLLSPVAFVSTSPNSAKAHALLIAAAPEEWVQIIVQFQPGAKNTEQLIQAYGGKLLDTLSIINAATVWMPAGQAVRLSTHRSVKWVSPDAPVESTACPQCVDTSKLANAYIDAINANDIWNESPYIQGKNIGIAVIDSGVNPNGDLYTQMGVNRQIADVRFNSDYNQSTSDGYGHGTHVASILAGDGSESNGKYIGVAPMANIINVKVSNDNGSARMTDIVKGLEWVLNNKGRHQIRVVNISLNSTVAESYHTSPLDAAVEILWFNGIVVVVSAGNYGSGAIYPPANDPFVITVGATDDRGTGSIADDTLASFSAYGTTEAGATKPEIVAPGRNITARLVNMNMGLPAAHKANIVNGQYFRMSGTSMAAPMVSGAVAMLLQDEPNLTPDQVKYRLMATANQSWPGYNPARAGAGYLDVYALVKGNSNQTANTGLLPSGLLTTGANPIAFGSVGWNSVGWNSVGWNSVGWNSVGWNSVGWNSDYWE